MPKAGKPEAPVPVEPDLLHRPVQFIQGVGPRRAKLLEGLGLRTVDDLLHHLPARYYDRRQMTPLAGLRLAVDATVQGVVTNIRSTTTARQKLPILELTIVDQEDSRAVLVWYNQPFREKEFRIGDTIVASGKVQSGRTHLRVAEFEILGEGESPVHAAGLIPSYATTEGLSKRQIRSLVRQAFVEAAPLAPEVIPKELLARRGLSGIRQALHQIHEPGTPEEAEAGRRRFAYEEFFRLQTELALRRRHLKRETESRRLAVSDTLNFRIRQLFPFKLTGAQDRAIEVIRKDLASGKPMNRLLQGDVGAGKTVVAAYALLAAVGCRAQAVLMAPTEILAEQHARTFRRLLGTSRVRVAFLGGGVKGKKREEILAAVAKGEVDLLIGTHAVIERDVRFKDLALTVIDEQQKFGVLQRAALGRKGARPHVLVMTATPIPRTLALTLYGDLDLTVLDELPPGRKDVRTLFVPGAGKRDKIAFILQKLREGRQAYFVYPLVDESDKLALQSAIQAHGQLTGLFKEFRVALLHGRMKPEEKEAVMEEFRVGRVHVLVSTLVIEVGIDVPNASVMVIDHCERYGLSQLHQLRGRIGRGPFESVCILFGKTSERIEVFVSTNDGFRIAEADLRIRGPGELLGTRQSGLPELKAARLLEDARLLEQAREDAFALVARDPALAGAPELRALLSRGRAASLLHVG
ncbi:MAG TPA: ATP-dependent DNA helicase RecG [Planctomycetota bacterium]|nr:ATP-dependent DNA helicase RecG [Planctomycetota bacterium]